MAVYFVQRTQGTRRRAEVRAEIDEEDILDIINIININIVNIISVIRVIIISLKKKKRSRVKRGSSLYISGRRGFVL